ncbi:halocyanin domain-containing protein [Salinigranum marinum]|uniref:halocyanin domain-containing protein n=1 Tax=Salinigranum marinum TaxID=1515595 RepID=UPI002989E98B|nr:halocyanin domain-containing protein [Salinigranum marinum]
MNERTESATRRRVLRTGAALGIAVVAGCSGGGESGGGTDGSDGDGNAGGGDSSTAAYDDWLSDVPNYDGSVADRTGDDSVTVAVGAGNGLFFDPPAVRVTTGTTVVWEWTGQGGQHNVAEERRAFESELATTAGTTFERTFDEPGVVRYLCVPHQAVGMKGVVDVVDG